MTRALAVRPQLFLETPRRERVELTVSEAFRLAVEALREVGRGDPEAEEAARMLDRRAMKARARETKSLVLPSYCLCGEGKTDEAKFCRSCMAAIPMKLWVEFHTAPAGKMGEAWQEIVDFVKLQRVVEVEVLPARPAKKSARRGKR